MSSLAVRPRQVFFHPGLSLTPLVLLNGSTILIGSARTERLALPSDQLHSTGNRHSRLSRHHGHESRTRCALRHSTPAAMVLPEFRWLRSDLLFANRRPALLLLLH